MSELYKAPEIKDVTGVCFTPLSPLIAIRWSHDYAEGLTTLPEEYGNMGCHELLGNQGKANLICHNTIKSNDSSCDGVVISKMFPLIAKLAELKIIVASRPVFSYQGRTLPTQMCKLPTTISDSGIVPTFEDDIGFIRGMLNSGQKVVIYSIGTTPTMYTPDDLTPFRGLMLRFAHFLREPLDVVPTGYSLRQRGMVDPITGNINLLYEPNNINININNYLL